MPEINCIVSVVIVGTGIKVVISKSLRKREEQVLAGALETSEATTEVTALHE